jgi:flagellar hook-associated protein 3 FlgL
MSILPISTVRTSSPLSHQRLLAQLNEDQLALQRHFDQLSSGKKILSISDDPAAAGRIITLNRDIKKSEQVVRNANATETFYDAADTSLATVNNALTQARGAAVTAAQNIISPDERAALAATIQESLNSVLGAGNNLFRDHKLVGGILGKEQAYQLREGQIVFNGLQAIGKTDIGGGDPASLNVSGGEALGAGEVFMQGGSLGASVERATRLVDLRQGEGVTPGVLRISGGLEFTDVDLRDAFTIGDIADILNEVEIEGRLLAATILPDGFRLEYADGLAGTLAVSDQLGSETAQQLAISNPSGIKAPPLIGDGLTPRVTENTRIVDLAGGAGLDLTGGIRLAQGDEVFDISFDDAVTLGDILIAFNRSGADVRAELDQAGGAIRLRALRSGVDYSIGENGGQAAENLRIRSATEDTLLRDLGKGVGLRLNADTPDLIIRRPDNVELQLNLEGVESIGDVIDLIRNHPSNQDSRKVLVDLNDIGNGIQLKAPPGALPLSVRQTGVSDAGIRLGLIPPGQNEATGSIVGAVDTLIGVDYATRDAGGALDTLLRMKKAVEAGDIPEIERLQAKLDVDLDRSSRTRGRIGVWSRNLDELRTTTEDRIVDMEAFRSVEADADLAKVISDISQRQLALEASMRLIGQTSQLTVLNYL